MLKTADSTRKIALFALWVAGTLFLCWSAFYNGFPLIYSDTGTYLESGFTFETPLDRPIMYGILLRIFSLNGFSAWGIILGQTFLLVTLLYLTVKSILPETKSAIQITAVAITVLALFSGLTWVSSELIADIFTPICILSFYLVLFANNLTKLQKVIVYIILMLSLACHISHVLIVLALVAGIALIRIFFRREAFRSSHRRSDLVMTSVCALIALSTMGASISKSRHVFMMGHLVETGILNAYLDDHCATEHISLCDYRDRIPPGAETFIWNSDGDSVLLLTGGWLGSHDEYSRIISETFSTPKYLKMHFIAAVTGTARQLYSIRIGEGMGKYDTSLTVSRRLCEYFPDEYAQYLASRQSKDEMAGFPILDAVNRIATVISLLIIVGWLLVARRKSKSENLLTVLIVIVMWAYLINCAVCASLATVANRFGARLSWLAIFVAVLLIADLRAHYRTNKGQAEINK